MAINQYAVYVFKLLCTMIVLVMVLDLVFDNGESFRYKYDKNKVLLMNRNHSYLKHYNLIINTYMRSGSTFLGKIFSIRNDTFYVFEPLWKAQTFAFYWGSSDVCHYSENKCAKQGNRAVSKDVGSSITWDASRNFLHSLMDCSFKHHETFLPDPRNFPKEFRDQKHSWVFGKGPLWNVYFDCAEIPQSTYNQCFSLIPPVCQKAHHKVLKVLRSTLDNFEEMLEINVNLKVIHLFRDPRAIVNSHLNTKFYQMKVKTTSQIESDIKTLCDRMIYDISIALRLKRLFPDRFKIVQYETFEDLYSSARALYKFMEMELTDEITQNLGKLIRTENSTKGFHPFNYRTSLPWETVKITNKFCSEVFTSLGYPLFLDKNSYQNLFNVPKVFPYMLY